MLKINTVIAGLLLTCVAAAASANLAKTGSVYFKGEPGSWVSGAVGSPEATWVHGVDGIFSTFSTNTNFNQGVSINYYGDAYWSFDFAAPTYNPLTNTNDGQPLTPKFYNNASRYPFNSPTKPGLSISGNGAGNNQLSGWFNVLEVDYGTNGDLLKFAVDFRQFDESLTLSGPSLYGSLRFNSAIPLSPVPEPSTYALLLAGLAIVVGRKVQQKRSIEA